MDDTNPAKEDVEYVDSIQEDVNWLIAGWADDRLGLKLKGKTPDKITSNGKPDFYLPPHREHAGSQSAQLLATGPDPQNTGPALEPFYASDYFGPLYEYALALIRKGKAYVCDLTPDETDEYRRQAKESPFRNRSVEENLDLFTRMKQGEFPMATARSGPKLMSPPQRLDARSPALSHPARRTSSHRQPMVHLSDVDFAHCLSDYLEASPTRSAHSSLRCIVRSTIDSRKLGPAASPPPIRVCPAEPRLHRHEQTQAPATRQRGVGRRMG